MLIDGRAIAEEQLLRLKIRVKTLKAERGVTPKLLIIQIGENPDSQSYIKQKSRAAEKIGIFLSLIKLPREVSFFEIAPIIRRARLNPKIHGILVQLPLPSHLEAKSLIDLIPASKDVDGLGEKNTLLNPTAGAVFNLLSYIYCQELKLKSLGLRLPVYQRLSELSSRQQGFLAWLKKQEIVLLGTGASAGRPIAQSFSQRKINLLVCDRSTPGIKRLLRRADIVIAAMGSPKLIKGEMLKKGVVAIGVGITRRNSKVLGDLEEESVSRVASYYTPTPGGVGPLTVAALLSNLVTAAARQSRS